MAKKERLNEEAALNNNLSAADLKFSKELDDIEEFSEELSDGGERNEFAKSQLERVKKGK